MKEELNSFLKKTAVLRNAIPKLLLLAAGYILYAQTDLLPIQIESLYGQMLFAAIALLFLLSLIALIVFAKRHQLLQKADRANAFKRVFLISQSISLNIEGALLGVFVFTGSFGLLVMTVVITTILSISIYYKNKMLISEMESEKDQQ